MKVSITCEECGRELLIYRPQEMNRPLFDTETDCDLSKVVAQLTCPRCNPPGPTYGPLTVEMVAEALCDAPPPPMTS